MKENIPALTPYSFTVNGVERSCLIATPESPQYILIVFHGNGGTADGFAQKYALEKILDHAVIVYFQGIPGIGGGFDPRGLKNGWQRKTGDGDDRDLLAIDELIKQLNILYPQLTSKVCAMGHSNGGRFTYLLMNQRANLFAGFVINAHQGVDLLEKFVPEKRIFIITGKQDRVVNNANQIKSAELIKSTLHLDHSEKINEELTIYTNKNQAAKLGHYIHAGGHDMPKTPLAYIQDFLMN